MSEKRRPEEEGAEIVPIGKLTREATFRRFAELVHRTDAIPPELADSIAQLPARQRGGELPIAESLAELVYDSDDDAAALAGIRGGRGGTRRLTFETEQLSLGVEVTLTGRRSLVCQIVPAQPAQLELRGANGAVRVASDTDGTFHLTDVASGPFSLRCRLEDGDAPVFATTWVRL